jgi:GNAT superfamily N-acetyltransferase
MPRPSIRAFAADDIPAAAQLLARRHAEQLRAEPLLSPRYTEPVTATVEINRCFRSDGASGAIAEVDGQVVGYLVGAAKAANVWGPNVWIEAPGHAAVDPETLRDLYAFAAADWVQEGRIAHYAVVPAHDAQVLDAWYRLGFGQQHVHAIREIPADPLPPSGRVTVRRARREDIAALAALDLVLPQHQGSSPVFSAGPDVPTLAEAQAEWEEDFDDEAFTTFVAEYDGSVIGSAVGCPLEKSSTHAGLSRPEEAAFLAFAAVFPGYQGLGAGRALGNAVIWWGAEAGYRSVVTDWRATNLLSSRTWPRLGFRPTFHRLHRLVGY